MSIATFIQEAKDAGFTDKQTVMLLDKFEEREGISITKEHLELALQANTGRLKHELCILGVGAMVFAMVPVYAKLFGVI